MELFFNQRQTLGIEAINVVAAAATEISTSLTKQITSCYGKYNGLKTVGKC
jgi:hypothetical protein